MLNSKERLMLIKKDKNIDFKEINFLVRQKVIDYFSKIWNGVDIETKEVL